MRSIFKRLNGSTLIEVIITLSLIGILTVLSIHFTSTPYTQSYRREAQSQLAMLAVAMERYYVSEGSYQGASLRRLGFAKNKDSFYQLQISVADKNYYLLSAIPLARQAVQDKQCGILFLDSVGERKISGTARLEDCW